VSFIIRLGQRLSETLKLPRLESLRIFKVSASVLEAATSRLSQVSDKILNVSAVKVLVTSLLQMLVFYCQFVSRDTQEHASSVYLISIGFFKICRSNNSDILEHTCVCVWSTECAFSTVLPPLQITLLWLCTACVHTLIIVIPLLKFSAWCLQAGFLCWLKLLQYLVCP